MSGLALGGGGLKGENLSHFVYLDESGIASLKANPFSVIAGVIIYADGQWKPIEKHLDALAAEYRIDSRDEDIVFHATDIYSGKNYFDDDDNFPLERRIELLTKLASIPSLFDLPLVCEMVDRREHSKTNKAIKLAALGLCSVGCAIRAERFMRELTSEREVATLVYENCTLSENIIKNFHDILRNRKMLPAPAATNGRKFIPFERIIDTAHFSEKRRCSVLQIADTIAFVTAKVHFREGKNYCDSYYELMRPQFFPENKKTASGLPFGLQ